MRSRVSFAIFVLMAFWAIGCGAGSLSAPTPVTVASATPVPSPTTVTAPPPQGVSAGVWLAGFTWDRRLRRPEKVEYVFNENVPQSMRDSFARMIPIALETIQGKTSITISDNGQGNFKVRLVDKTPCGTGACTSLAYDGGLVKEGLVEFTTDNPGEWTILHEIFRTLGVMGTSPVPGIMSVPSWTETRPSTEERIMLLARYDYPLLALFSEQ